MRCPHDKIELIRKYHIEDFINRVVIFEYDFCKKCYRRYDVNRNEIIVIKDGSEIIRSGKKALK